MRKTISYCIISLCLLVTAANSLHAQVMKFDYYEGLIFLRVTVNDKDSLLFLMDTGANVSAIDKAVADKLMLQSIAKDSVEGTAGKMMADKVKLNRLGVGKSFINDLTITMQDMGHMIVPHNEQLAGILGMDFLKHYTVAIDFLKHEINFLKVKMNKSTDLPLLFFKMDNDIPRTSVTINGIVHTDLRYDSGASLLPTNSVYINITEDVFKKLKAADTSLKPHEYLQATGIGGSMKLPVVHAISVKNDNGTIDATDIELVVQPKQGYFASKDAVGFFSNNLLEKFKRVAIDFGSGFMVLGPGKL